MAVTRAGLIGRVAYGAAFVIALPAALVAWAAGTAEVVHLPAYRWPAGGAALVAVGALLMASGMLALGRHGGGLPMNAFPPPRFVRRGAYRWLAHPIYLGFVLACAGVALASGSASGLWLVTPATAAGAAALVLGYERLDLRRRFGDAVARPLIALPAAEDRPAGARERVSVYLLVLLPWLVAYEAVQFMGVPPDAVSSHFAFERAWPVLPWTELPYASVYLLVLATPLLPSSARALRRFAVTGLVATAVVTLVYLCVPLVAPPRTAQSASALGRLLAQERSFNNTVAAFPAFHVLWALIAADAWPRPARRSAFLWAMVIAASCVTTGMHSIADVVAAFVAFPLFRRYDDIWEALRALAERTANSWSEWRFGPVRVIVHGIYPALAGFGGMLIAGSLAGPQALPGVAIVGVASLLGAGLWAQWLEGSSALLRPFGFFGGLAGGIIGALVAGLLGQSVWLLLGAYSVALPWVQATGRLRCLVQGCCHGGVASDAVGIRYQHPRSRVTRLAGLQGMPLHPTPLYSILGNVVVGVLVARLWSLATPPSFVFGAYLVLSGFARFVEEGYRAEPQTPVIGGLHVYHWFAIASVAVGIAATCVPSTPPVTAVHPVGPWLALAAVGMGLAGGFCMGVDFPASNARFSRLAAADDLTRGKDAGDGG